MAHLHTIASASSKGRSTGFVPRFEEEEWVRDLLRPCFPSDAEYIAIAGFDEFDRLLCLEIAGDGKTSRGTITPQCWRAVIAARPAKVVLAHNHPSGVARPSDGDRSVTREAGRLLALLDIALSDHLIFTADGHFSFRRAGML